MSFVDKTRMDFIAHNNTPTPYELGLMCKAVGKNDVKEEFPNYLKDKGWMVIDNFDITNDYAYKGVGFINEKIKKLVIAHRATDLSRLEDLVSDVHIAFEKESKANKEAEKKSQNMRKKYQGYKIIETGHSLGAIQAELNTYKFNDCVCVTFDSPGSKGIIEAIKPEWNKEVNPENFTTYLSNPNFINTANSHIGRKIRVFTNNVEDTNTTDLCTPLYILYNVFKNPIEAVQEMFLSIPKAIFNFEINKHSLDNILKNFDQYTGQPLLQRNIISWPKRWSYLESILETKKLLGTSFKTKTKKNQSFEKLTKKIEGYEVSDFLLPKIDPIEDTQNCSQNINFLEGVFEMYRYFYGGKDVSLLKMYIDLHKINKNINDKKINHLNFVTEKFFKFNDCEILCIFVKSMPIMKGQSKEKITLITIKVLIENLEKDIDYNKLSKEEKFLMKVVCINGLALKHFDEKYRSVFTIVHAAVKQNGLAIKFTNDKLQNDKKIALDAIKENGLAYSYVHKDIEEDKDLFMETLIQGLISFDLAPKKLKNDVEILYVALRVNCLKEKGVFQDRSSEQTEELRKELEGKINKERVFIEALSEGLISLSEIPKDLKNDFEIMLTAVKNDGLQLEFIDYKLLKQNPYFGGPYLRYIYEELPYEKLSLRFPQQNFAAKGRRSKFSLTKYLYIKIVLEAIKQNSSSLQFVPEKLRKRKDVMEAVKASFREHS